MRFQELSKWQGMEKYFEKLTASQHLPNVTVVTAPGAESKTTTHGGFDDDLTTMGKVISLIKDG